MNDLFGRAELLTRGRAYHRGGREAPSAPACPTIPRASWPALRDYTHLQAGYDPDIEDAGVGERRHHAHVLSLRRIEGATQRKRN